VCLDSTGKQPWNLIEIQSHHKTKVPLSSADTIPNFPSDWLPFDPRFTVYNALGGCNFQKKNYEKFFERFYKCKEYHREDQVKEQSTDSDDDDDDDGDDNDDGDNDNYDMDIKQAKASDVLHNTIKQLKEEGNKASKEGNIHLAASYYDKALRYCSIVFMHYNFSNIILADQYFVMHLKNGYNVDWSPLFKTYISVLLNLGLVNLKPEINDPETAARQLKNVLDLLFPFVKKPGMIVTAEGPNLEKQPIEIYKEAKEFEAKAYFRLGSAMMEMKKFTHAIAFYEECLESQKSIHPDSPPDKHILRKLSIAKNQAEKKKQRDRKRAKYSYADVFLHDDSD
jgi:tetratricopeptide (TPR) repeat protein